MLNRRNLLTSAGLAVTFPQFANAASLPEARGPYALPNTAVHVLPDPVSQRAYEVWIDLPPSYDSSSGLLPAVFVTDAPYAFPVLRALRSRVGQGGRNMADFVLVGLAGPAQETPTMMRNRDYTPTLPRARADYGDGDYGGGAAYLRYVADVAVPAVTGRYRIDASKRVILGHSYGALFATQLLFARPELFSHYVLGSPSLWFDDHVMFDREAAYARAHRDLAARVFQYVGAYETVRPGPRYNRHRDLVNDMRRLERVLRGRRYASLSIESHVIADEDHLTVAPIGATRGLLWALPGRGPYEG
ncbi:alpha/beta hydrolase [Roseateles cellulosilyticus]|uniref:Alpha/beta hydrolase n=1 Tax=Pelomonas cellulosilytica TaxID=2906762 RepID=A0ABS8XQ70_9BURK|nr:alpha/beta hydrolase-fold protein [Pelomonas sp. P8]MCE4553435.1 alpha/beta hydrolase [Pelomonas sp. P8]